MAAASKSDSRRNHRRDTRRWIMLPMLLIGLPVLIGTGIVLALPSRFQVSIIADWMVSILILCPSVICLFVVCMLLIIAIAGMNKLHRMAARPLYRVHDWSEQIVEKAANLGQQINRRAVGIGSRFAFVNEWMRFFDPEKPAKNGPDSTKDSPP